jgi:hypothetical protein
MLEQFNKIILVLIVYILLYSIVIFFKPEIIFNTNKNCTRQFGVGYKNTTILPLWLVSILIAILSYFIVLYIIHIRYNSIFVRV